MTKRYTVLLTALVVLVIGAISATSSAGASTASTSTASTSTASTSTASTSTASTSTAGRTTDPVVFRDADRGKWQPCEGLPGCEQLLGRTDKVTGATESVFRFKAGTKFDKHFHTSPEHVVGIAGIMVWHLENGRTYRIGAGDFLYYPSKMVHWGKCSAGSDCVFHVYDDLPYDFHVVK